jgi:DNA-binding IclR family transcriptional regulator
MTDHRREMLQLIEGSPQPDLSVAELGRAIGLSEEQAERLVEDLERDGQIVRDGDRLIAVEAEEDTGDRESA